MLEKWKTTYPQRTEQPLSWSEVGIISNDQDIAAAKQHFLKEDAIYINKEEDSVRFESISKKQYGDRFIEVIDKMLNSTLKTGQRLVKINWQADNKNFASYAIVGANGVIFDQVFSFLSSGKSRPVDPVRKRTTIKGSELAARIAGEEEPLPNLGEDEMIVAESTAEATFHEGNTPFDAVNWKGSTIASFDIVHTIYGKIWIIKDVVMDTYRQVRALRNSDITSSASYYGAKGSIYAAGIPNETYYWIDGQSKIAYAYAYSDDPLTASVSISWQGGGNFEIKSLPLGSSMSGSMSGTKTRDTQDL